jgi:transcriptional regulator with XRE-family HTH domain
MDVFTATLKTAMARKKLTQQDLARESGIHFVTINRILNGAVENIGFDTAEKLLRAAGVKPEKIFREVG